MTAADSPPDQPFIRRRLLGTDANPDPGHDYLVHWLSCLGTDTRLSVRYVPDRLILTADAWNAYAAALAPLLGPSAPAWPPERLALAVLADLDDALLPRWLQVTLTVGESHAVVIEDSQPGWSNPALLARLAPL